MRFNTVATALVLATLAQAFTFPADLKDGVYSAYTADNGTEVHTRLADLPSDIDDAGAPPITTRSLETRQQGQIWCGCGFNMDPSSCDAAVADLKSQLGRIINAGQAFYSIRGSVVAFACNRQSIGWLALPQDLTDSLAKITGACGRYIAGAYDILGANPSTAAITGYARYASGDDLCAGSTSSPAGSC